MKKNGVNHHRVGKDIRSISNVVGRRINALSNASGKAMKELSARRSRRRSIRLRA
jgi:hypothetical protein